MRFLMFLIFTAGLVLSQLSMAGVLNSHKVTAEDTCLSADGKYRADYQVIQVWRRETPVTSTRRLEDIFKLNLRNKGTGEEWRLQEVDGHVDIDLAYRFSNSGRHLSIKTKTANGETLSIHLSCGKTERKTAIQLDPMLGKIALKIPRDYFRTIRNDLPNFVNGSYFAMPFEAKKFMRFNEATPVCSISRQVPHFLQADTSEAQTIELSHEAFHYELSFVGESEREWFRLTCHEAELVEESVKNRFGFSSGRTEFYLNRSEAAKYYSAEQIKSMLLQALPEGMIHID